MEQVGPALARVDCWTRCWTHIVPVPNVSVKLYQKASKQKADGTAPVYVRVTANRKTSLRSTGVYVRPRDWNENRQRVRASHDLADALNAKLAEHIHEAQRAALDSASAKAAKAALDGSSGTLTAYFERFIDRLRAQGARSHWEVKKYSSTLAKLRGALGDELSWGEVDRDALQTFERYCRQTKKNNPNTVRKELTRLRRVYKEAIRDGAVKPSEDPFLVYQKPKGRRVERRKLPLAAVEKLAALGPADGLAEGSFDGVARDAFVFSFYAGGMRFGDVAKLKASEVNGGRATYRMLKTGTPMSVPLPPAAVVIADRYRGGADGRGGYLFPLLEAGAEGDGVHLRKRISSRNAQVNAALKRLAVLADIEPDGLSFHVARHSFADYARRQSGDLYAISKSLGHGNLQTTETYLKSFDRDAVDGLADQLWKRE